jgi:rhamnosyltransferase
VSVHVFSVSLVVPVRNPGPLWSKWLPAVHAQATTSVLLAGLVVDSASDDGTEYGDLPAGWQLLRIAAEDFNHGGTRNLALQHLPAGTDVVVFMTQDALLVNVGAVQALADAFVDLEVGCAYGRQLPHDDATPIAAHARLFNYPATSRVVKLADKARFGLKACFLSNSFAAYRLTDLQAVGGFPSDVILGEDMSVAARLLMAGKRVAYVADACVYHSHNYSLMQEFRRYFDTGVFHARSPWLLQEFGSANGEGLRFVRSELAYLRKHAPHLIPSAIVRTLAKWLGYKFGQLEAFMPLKIKLMCSMHKGYWRKQADKEQAVV